MGVGMRTLIIADELFASRERALLSRLEVGLADEGVRVVQALPETDMGGGQGTELFSTVVKYSTRTVALTRSFAARKLLRAIAARLGEDDDARIDLVHVFGGASWGLGKEIAELLGAQLLLEVWRSGLVDRAAALVRAQRGREDGIEPVLIAPDPAIEKLLNDGGCLTRPAWWGVHVPGAVRDVLPEGRAISAMIVGSGRDPRAFVAALTGLAEALRDTPDAVIFCDALAARRAGLWAVAKKVGVLHRLTLIAELEGRRDLLVHGDLLIQPDALGEQRSILLEAMAAGMVVIAARDPMVSTLIEGKTARLVDRPDPAAWRETLASVLRDRGAARALALGAGQFVRANRLASMQVRQVLAVYEWMMSKQAIPLAGAGRA